RNILVREYLRGDAVGVHVDDHEPAGNVATRLKAELIVELDSPARLDRNRDLAARADERLGVRHELCRGEAAPGALSRSAEGRERVAAATPRNRRCGCRRRSS